MPLNYNPMENAYRDNPGLTHRDVTMRTVDDDIRDAQAGLERLSELAKKIQSSYPYPPELLEARRKQFTRRLELIDPDLIRSIAQDIGVTARVLTAADLAEQSELGTRNHTHVPVKVAACARWFRHGGNHPLSIEGAAYTWCTACGEILSLDNDVAVEAMQIDPDEGSDEEIPYF